MLAYIALMVTKLKSTKVLRQIHPVCHTTVSQLCMKTETDKFGLVRKTGW